MKWRTAVMAVLLALPLSAEPAEIMYYNFFGDYLAESPYQVDINIRSTSLSEIKVMLEQYRNSNYAIDSDLVVIGYGPAASPDEFFAATPCPDYQIPLEQVLNQIPRSRPNSKWHIYFIDRSISHYVREHRDHHWASPFRWLSQIGLQEGITRAYHREPTAENLHGGF